MKNSYHNRPMKKDLEEVSKEMQVHYFGYLMFRILDLTSVTFHDFKVADSIDDLSSFDSDISWNCRALSEETAQKTKTVVEVMKAST